MPVDGPNNHLRPDARHGRRPSRDSRSLPDGRDFKGNNAVLVDKLSLHRTAMAEFEEHDGRRLS